MKRSKLLLLSVCIASMVFTCGMGKAPAGASQGSKTPEDIVADFEEQIKDITINSWLKTSYEGRYQFSYLSEDKTVCQIVITSDYKAEDINDLIDECVNKMRVLNVVITDNCPIQTMYLKYLDNKDKPLFEFTFERTSGEFAPTSYLMSLDDIDTISRELLKRSGGN